MANRFRGEITAACDGVTYTLRMDMNTLAAFEDATGKLPLDWLDEAAQGKLHRVAEIRTMLRCAMLRHHPDATDQLAGDVLSEDGEAVMRLIEAAVPQVEAPAPGNQPAPETTGRD